VPVPWVTTWTGDVQRRPRKRPVKPVECRRAGPVGPGAGYDRRVVVGTPVDDRSGGALVCRRTTPAPSVVDPALALRGLGTWVDTYDYGSLSPQGAISDVRAHDVRTLYLATARFNSPTDMLYPADVDAWLTAAHAAGMRVVGWYEPDYTDLALDVRRTLAIARFRSPTGQHFDALAVDIEYPLRVSDAAAWHAAVAAHLTQIRAATSMPLGAIVLPPLLMSAWPDPTRWSGFPWTSIGHTADAVLLMSYWTSYTPARLCPTDPR
jgi:hypothetical protein